MNSANVNRTGRIKILSEPVGAVAYADGNELGLTPLEIDPDKSFRSGFVGLSYRYFGKLTLKKAGCETWSTEVDDAVLAKDVHAMLKCASDSSASSGSTAGEHMAVFIKKGRFEDVRDDVDMAITGRGLVVNNVSHVGEMLERTGKDLGDTKPIFLKAEALEFCSAVLSRKMMEANPDNIVFCPYIISIYVLPEKPDEVRIAYRKPQLVGSPASQKALREVDELLSGIVKEALQ